LLGRPATSNTVSPGYLIVGKSSQEVEATRISNLTEVHYNE
jgi:hypothetical protein